jgi:DNA-binding PadR family transcriptional regulator
MLELAILGLLKERPMHGYELRKQLGVRLGFFWTVSFGSLYPTLRRLERAGSIEKLRPTEPSSRRRQAYRITAEGEVNFLNLLEEGTSSAWEEDKFPLRLAFFRHVRPEVRIRLLQRRKEYLEEKLDEGRRSLSRAKRGRADLWTLSLMRHGVEVTERDIQWLDELIAAERGQPDAALPGGSEQAPEDPVSSADPEPAPPTDEPTQVQAT